MLRFYKFIYITPVSLVYISSRHTNCTILQSLICKSITAFNLENEVHYESYLSNCSIMDLITTGMSINVCISSRQTNCTPVGFAYRFNSEHVHFAS